jgi:hypothetical protein
MNRGECRHEPRCPSAQARDRDAAQMLVCHPEQGWTLLCNGVVVFDDLGELLPDRTVVLPRRVRSEPKELRPEHRTVAKAGGAPSRGRLRELAAPS